MDLPIPELIAFVLETERLRLRPLTDADAPAMAALATDRRVADGTLALPHPYTVHNAETFIQVEREDRARGRMAASVIERRADTTFMGMIGLVLQREWQRAELGYWLGVPFWNQGYITEAAGALVDYAFGTLGLNRVFACHFADNPASGRVMQKIGMTQEGVLRQHYVRFDQPKDTIYYGLLREEWQARR